MDYTTLSLAQMKAELDAIARDGQATCGRLSARQLNWRPDAAQWSVGQCLEHLLATNALMMRASKDALSGSAPRSLWQRLPVWPGVMGRMLIRSQSPDAARRFTAAPNAQPSASDVAADVVPRFVMQHGELVAWMRTLDADDVSRTVMTSPFASAIAYSVLDGCRLLVAHDRRHLQQARRVTAQPMFPAEGA